MFLNLSHKTPNPCKEHRLIRASVGASLILLALTLVSCVAPIATTIPDADQPAEAAIEEAKADVTVVHTDAELVVPETIPAGLQRITIQNNGETWHATIIRRLKNDVTMDEFEAAFQENPFGSLPLTVQLGGPDLAPGLQSDALFQFEPGDYVVVDNWTEPPRMQPFSVIAGDEVADSLPKAMVTVEMREHEFVMPATIEAGPQWWSFHNTGEAVHQAGIAQLAPDKTVEDIVLWFDTEDGPPPWEDVAFWNVMSPGQQSWGQMDLPPGDYLLLDYLPDFTNEGLPNFMLGMAKEFTVVE